MQLAEVGRSMLRHYNGNGPVKAARREQRPTAAEAGGAKAPPLQILAGPDRHYKAAGKCARS